MPDRPHTPVSSVRPESPAGPWSRHGRILSALIPGTYLLYLLRFGYRYAESDQDEFLPYLYHRLHPELFRQDWFVQFQAAEFGIRTTLVYLLQGLSSILPVWASVLFLYLIAWAAIAAGLYAVAWCLTHDRLTAALTVPIVTVFTPHWTLGGNDFLSSMLAPSVLGWALGLWGVVAFLRGRMGVAGALIGAATALQALIGLQLAALLVAVALLGVLQIPRDPSPPPPAFRSLLLFAVAYLVTAGPVLVPLIAGQFGAPAVDPAPAPSIYYIVAAFRNPHHYLFHSFPVRALVRFMLLCGLGVVAWWALAIRAQVPRPTFLIRCLLMIAVACVTAYVGTEGVPLLTIAKLQLFKLTVIARLLLVVLIVHALVVRLPERVDRPLRRLAFGTPLPWIGTAAAWGVALVLLVVPGRSLRDRIPALQTAPHDAVTQWVRSRTPVDAVFAVPPSFDSFRSQARRAIVVDFKAFPYDDARMVEWLTRLITLAPIPLPARAGPDLQQRLDAAFADLPADALRRAAAVYGFTYVVRDRPLASSPFFEEVFRSESWYVYRTASPDPAPL